MPKSLWSFLLVLAIAVSSSTALADTSSPPAGFEPNNQTWLQQWDQWIDQFGEQIETWTDDVLGISDVDSGSSTGGGGSVAAPEMDPAGILGAFTLLAGGLAVIRGRRAK
jgi:hypothetical protein